MPATSSDPFYNGYNAADVTVRVLDDGIERVYVSYITNIYPPFPHTPVLAAIDNADVNGSYTVSWNQARKRHVVRIAAFQ